MLSPTPPERLTDPQGRPYFLWDCEMTLEELRRALRDCEPAARAYLVAKLMRQARPDDVLSFVSVEEILELWGRVEGRLGTARRFRSWLVGRWAEQDRGAGQARPSPGASPPRAGRCLPRAAPHRRGGARGPAGDPHAAANRE